MSLLKYFITFMLGVLLLSACTTLEMGVEHTPRSPLPTTTRRSAQIATATATDADAVATALARLTITPSSTPTPDPRAYVGLPEKGLLYLGNPQQSLALFLRSNSNSSADPNLGSIWYLDKSFRKFEYVWYLASGSVPTEPPFDFRDFSRPYPVTGVSKIGQVYDVKRGSSSNPVSDRDTRFAYVSYNSEDAACPLSGPDNESTTPCSVRGINRLLEIDMDTAVAREIWAHDLSSEVYPEFHGVALIDQVAGPIEKDGDRYLVLRLLPCLRCKAYQPQAMLLLNARTGQELYLGPVGNVYVDFIGKVVSYQNLEKLQVERCAGTIGGTPQASCKVIGYVAYDMPTGELLTQPLP